ncbi:MAG: hypothetical protein ABW066_01940 [Sedimenticola sp.]
METKEFNAQLLRHYLDRDVEGIISLVSSYKNDTGFQPIRQKLIKKNRLSFSSNTLEEITNALILEIEDALSGKQTADSEESFFDIGEKLKRHYNKEIADLYMDTWMPNDFVLGIREQDQVKEHISLTESTINAYKQEFIRIKKGLTALHRVLEPYSSFPISNCTELGRQLSALFTELSFNQKYILARPFILQIIKVSENSGNKETVDIDDLDETSFSFFRHYVKSGIEPPIADQVELHIAIKKLFICIANEALLDQQKHNHFWAVISRILAHRAQSKLPDMLKVIFIELLQQVDADQSAIMERLSESFLEEYRKAEVDMLAQYQLIEKELLYTIEYFERVKAGEHQGNPRHAERVELAREKLLFLTDVFPLLDLKREEIANTSTINLERAAFGVAAEITPTQLNRWIRIYSILFSNRDIMDHTGHDLDFTVMHNLISHLTTYHLVHNITLLRNVVDKTLKAPDEEKSRRFKLFNEALKLRLDGLMHMGKSEEISLQKMIEDLGFIENQKIQFVIADTFNGFQEIVDAFNASANDYFVQDREALMKESKGLYNDICNMCMKGLVHRPRGAVEPADDAPEDEKEAAGKSWLDRLLPP